MSGKSALIISNSDYSDPKLAKLTAPTKDAEALAEVLKAPDLAAFDEVTTLLNEPESVARRAIAKFFVDRKSDDLLLLYFSGHGIRDEQGRLFLAMPDTDASMLDATAVSSEFVTRQMDNTRSRRQLLILDCCNSGAFASGTKGATGTSMGTGGAFEGTGYGRVVLTATDTTQFAWEGDQIIGEEAATSLFTHFLVKGLEGEADSGGDGIITADELYAYTYGEIVRRTPKQTPGKWAYREQGQIVLTTRVRPQTVKPLPLDPDLEQDLQSTRNYVREAAVSELGNVLNGPNLGRALSAQLKLKYVAENDDSRSIAHKAAQLLEEYQASRGIPAANPASAPPTVEEAPASQPGLVPKQPVRPDSAASALDETKKLKSAILPVTATIAALSKLELRRYVLIAAVGVVVFAMIGLAWRALVPVPAPSPVPSRGVQAPVSVSSPLGSTFAATQPAVTSNSPLQLGTWSIDYFQGTQLSGSAVYHVDQPAGQDTNGGFAVQIKSADLRNNLNVPASNFSMRLSGLFNFSGGIYDLHCEHQDGCRVYIDGDRSIDAWSDGTGTADVKRSIAAGNHQVSIEFYDKSGQGALQVFWKSEPQAHPTPTLAPTASSTPRIIPTATKKKKDNGSGSPPSICIAFGTRIDTPNGPVSVEDLAIGEVVWTMDSSGARIAMPITSTRQVPVPLGTQLLRLFLSDGREVRVSPPHPMSNGRPVGELRSGDRLDGAQVIRIEPYLYVYAYTYDLLPAGPTGVYWADGILLGSTLKYHVVP